MRSSSISTPYGASQLQLHPVNDLLARDISRSLSVEYFSNTKNPEPTGSGTPAAAGSLAAFPDAEGPNLFDNETNLTGDR